MGEKSIQGLVGVRLCEFESRLRHHNYNSYLHGFGSLFESHFFVIGQRLGQHFAKHLNPVNSDQQIWFIHYAISWIHITRVIVNKNNHSYVFINSRLSCNRFRCPFQVVKCKPVFDFPSIGYADRFTTLFIRHYFICFVYFVYCGSIKFNRLELK